MPSWTLQQAKERLEMWMEAEATVSTGQSYRIATRSLTRASLREISERISFWRAEVERLEAGRRSGARVMRVVPRDL
jgi:uncharacterized small protein (DUF1192 family)